MEQQQKFDFAIIGGGVYGLSIAYHLAKSQQTVALFER
jgi:glycine/D-amino acid oxidase-like deaminating enzyme